MNKRRRYKAKAKRRVARRVSELREKYVRPAFMFRRDAFAIAMRGLR